MPSSRGSSWSRVSYAPASASGFFTTSATWEAQFSSVQSLSHAWLFATPWIAARQASLSITNSQSLLKRMPIESVMPSSHLIICRPLLLLPPIPPSIRVFSNESALLIRWPKYWSFQWTPRTDLLQDGLVGSPCSTRDSQESSPTPQFKAQLTSIEFSKYLSFYYIQGTVIFSLRLSLPSAFLSFHLTEEKWCYSYSTCILNSIFSRPSGNFLCQIISSFVYCHSPFFLLLPPLLGQKREEKTQPKIPIRSIVIQLSLLPQEALDKLQQRSRHYGELEGCWGQWSG